MLRAAYLIKTFVSSLPIIVDQMDLKTSAPFIVGITGGSGSGKSTFTKHLVEKLQGQASVLTLDNYYYPLEQQPKDPQGHPNFDLPESLNLTRFHQDLMLLKKGKNITQKEYTFNVPGRVPKDITVKPAKVLLVEGLYIFQQSETESLYDLKIFIDTEEEAKLQRRILRDAAERGYNEMDVHYTHKHHVTPSFEKHIRHFISKVDLVVPNHQQFNKAVEVIASYLRTRLATDD